MNFFDFFNRDYIKNKIVKAMTIGDEKKAVKFINKSSSKLSLEAFDFVIKVSVESEQMKSFESLLSSRNLDENLILKVAKYTLDNNHSKMHKTLIDKTANYLSNETKLNLLEMAITHNSADGIKSLLKSISKISDDDFKRLLAYPRAEGNYEILSTIIKESVNKINPGSKLKTDIYNELFRTAAIYGEENLLKAFIEKAPNNISPESYGEALNQLIQKEQYDKLYLFNDVNKKIPRRYIDEAKIAFDFLLKNKNISPEKHAKNVETVKKAMSNLKTYRSKLMKQDSKALKSSKNDKSSSKKNFKDMS